MGATLRRLAAGILVAQALAGAAVADFNSAYEAYQRGDFAKAFAEFKALAEVGHAPSQFNLALMYGYGQGEKYSDELRYAWLKLAAAGGSAPAQAALASLATPPTPAETAAAGRIDAEFGTVALAQRLLPSAACASPDFVLPGSKKPTVPAYPDTARRDGTIGWVVAELYVAPDGRAHDAHIVEAVPAGAFEDAVYRAVFSSEWQPARSGDKAVGAWGRFAYAFTLTGYDEVEKHPFFEFEQRIAEAAERGEAGYQYVHSLMLESGGLPVEGRERVPDFAAARTWMIRAAQGGVAAAQYQLARMLLDTTCDAREREKALHWMRLAARAGFAQAQVMMARILLSDARSDSLSAKAAHDWLEMAASSSDPIAQRMLIESLATSATPDPQRALALCAKLMPRFDFDPKMHELRAAVHAAAGQFDKAIEDQTRALELARQLDWDLQPLQERLHGYRQGKRAAAGILTL